MKLSKILLVITLACTTVQAATMTVEEFTYLRKSDQHAYLAGVISGLLQNPFADPTKCIWIPKDVTLIDERELILNWIKEHPATLSHSMPETVQHILHETYPCGAKDDP